MCFPIKRERKTLVERRPKRFLHVARIYKLSMKGGYTLKLLMLEDHQVENHNTLWEMLVTFLALNKFS